MKKILLSALIALPMTAMAADTYKIFSMNQSTNFFEGNSSGDSGGSLGETGPGPTTFVGGDEQAGFYGEVSVDELFSGDELASEIGLSGGGAQYNNESWLKFAYEGKILYIAKKPYRYNVSWNMLNGADAVYGKEGDAMLSKADKSYKVRLLRCASNSPTNWNGDNTTEGESNSYYDPAEGIGSEWNDLMFRIHQHKPKTQEKNNWANYVDSELAISSGDGHITWCQEKPFYNETERIHRGGSLSKMNDSERSFNSSLLGWRPVLELQ